MTVKADDVCVCGKPAWMHRAPHQFQAGCQAWNPASKVSPQKAARVTPGTPGPTAGVGGQRDAVGVDPASPTPAPDVVPVVFSYGPGRCEECGWRFSERMEDGCVPGNCSFRPDDPSEQAKLRLRRRQLAIQKEEIENLRKASHGTTREVPAADRIGADDRAEGEVPGNAAGLVSAAPSASGATDQPPIVERVTEEPRAVLAKGAVSESTVGAGGQPGVPAGYRLGDGWALVDVPPDRRPWCGDEGCSTAGYFFVGQSIGTATPRARCIHHALQSGALVPVEPPVAEPPGFRIIGRSGPGVPWEGRTIRFARTRAGTGGDGAPYVAGTPGNRNWPVLQAWKAGQYDILEPIPAAPAAEPAQPVCKHGCGVETRDTERPCKAWGGAKCFRPAFGRDQDRCFCTLECRDAGRPLNPPPIPPGPVPVAHTCSGARGSLGCRACSRGVPYVPPPAPAAAPAKAPLSEYSVSGSTTITFVVAGSPSTVTCFHCGKQLQWGSREPLDHWRDCEKHPARAEVERLRAKLEDEQCIAREAVAMASEADARVAAARRQGWKDGAEAMQNDASAVCRDVQDEYAIDSLPLPPCPEGPPAGTADRETEARRIIGLFLERSTDFGSGPLRTDASRWLGPPTAAGTASVTASKQEKPAPDLACHCSDFNSSGQPCPPGTCPNRPMTSPSAPAERWGVNRNVKPSCRNEIYRGNVRVGRMTSPEVAEAVCLAMNGTASVTGGKDELVARLSAACAAAEANCENWTSKAVRYARERNEARAERDALAERLKDGPTLPGFVRTSDVAESIRAARAEADELRAKLDALVQK